MDLWPIGHRFRRGHRIRVHVAGGAYPRIARDLGTGEPPGTGSAMVATGHEVFHDPSPAAPARPSPPEPVPAAVAGAPGLGSGCAQPG